MFHAFETQESLMQTDCRSFRSGDIHGQLKKQKSASYIKHMAIYMGFVGPWQILRLAFQQKINDSLRIIRRIQDST